MSLTSANPKLRDEALRRLIRRLAAEHSRSVAELARHLGRSRQWLDARLADDGPSLPMRDVCMLAVQLPGLLEEIAGACGSRVVPSEGAVERAHVVHAATSLLRATTDASAAAMDAIADGRVDRREAADIRKAVATAQQKLAVLEAACDAAENVQ